MADAEGNFSKPTKIFSGKAIETFEQSPTKSVSGWKDGKRHGETIEYFYNGRKRRVIRFAEGVRQGEAEEYRITGELLRVETYSDNVLNGPKKEWHPNGAKVFQVGMKEGKPHGEALEWFPDESKKSSTFYRHGLREDLPPNGILPGQQSMSISFQKDKRHGLKTTWYENGQKRIVADFIDDMMEGNSRVGSPTVNLPSTSISRKIKSTEFAPNGTRTAKRSPSFDLSTARRCKI